MTMDCDRSGCGRNIAEFDAYFRTQRWNQGPDADQPGLGENQITANIASCL